MSFQKSQSYQELHADWRWNHAMDAEAAAATDQRVKEHPEEWKEVERILYYSEANFYKRVALDSLEVAEMKQHISYDPEAFLPEEVRNAIYDDKRWFDRAKYLPKDSDEDPLMYVSKELDKGLRELTELQREILFRTVINGESTESVARDKQCSVRNIRDVRGRALQYLRKKITHYDGFGTVTVLLVVLAFLLVCYVGQKIAASFLPTYLWLEYVGCAMVIVCLPMMMWRSRNGEIKKLLRLR